MFGRAGLLNQAYGLLSKMPIEANSVVWLTLYCLQRKRGSKNFEIPVFFVNQKLVVLHQNKFMFTIFEINLVLILPVAKCL
ncbi:hypothetical protein Hanom_Chr03g00190941 [Helianthus anomalus]